MCRLKFQAKPLVAPPAAPSAPATAAKVEDKASLGSKEEIVSTAPVTAPIVVPKNTEKPQIAGTNTAQSATKTVVMPDPSIAAKAAQEKAAQEKAAVEKAKAEAVAKTKAETEAKAKAEAAKAQALLDGKAAPSAAPTGERFIVQFGSFAEEAKAREVRQKVEKAGLKTYAQVAETSEGKRHRVRVGPFPTRAEAEKAAAKIKALDLPANILTL
jgi:DedD protein